LISFNLIRFAHLFAAMRAMRSCCSFCVDFILATSRRERGR